MKKTKKKKSHYEEYNGIFGSSVDYAVYHLNNQERIIGFLIWGGIAFAAVQIFFGSFPVSLILGMTVGIFGIRFYAKGLKEKRSNVLLRQFRDMLESLSTSLSSGKNMTNAFLGSTQELKDQYGPEAYIVQELSTIAQGLENNVNIETLLDDFARRSHLEDVENFANVFSVANRRGGNLREIVFETKNVISDKINTEMEIQTLISGKKNELTIMMILPFIVVTQISGMQTDNSGDLGSALLQIGVKIAALFMFAGAYFLGKKIMDIHV